MKAKIIESEPIKRTGTRVPILTNGIGTRITEISSRVGGKKKLAEMITISEAQLHRIVSGDSQAKVEAIAEIAAATEVSLEWLATGNGRMQSCTGNQINEKSVSYDVNGFSLIPLYDVSASAGQGAAIEQERVSSQIAFRQEWLNQEGLSAKGLAAITAKGDSMEPTIADGALLLVDSSQRRISNDSIYILRWDGHLYAKRLQLMFSGAVCIISDNKIYKEETISPDDAAGLDIVGRVVWVGQKI